MSLNKKEYIAQWHRLKKKTHVIVKFKERQQTYETMVNINKRKDKRNNLKELVLWTRYLSMKV